LFFGNIAIDNIINVFNSKRARKIRNDLFYVKNAQEYSTFCCVCDFAREHKIFYFMPFLSRLAKQIIYAFLNTNYYYNYVNCNSTKEIYDNLIEFEKLFCGNNDEWMDVVSKLRSEYYKCENETR